MSAPLMPQPHRDACRNMARAAIVAEIRETQRLERRLGRAVANLKARQQRHAAELAARDQLHARPLSSGAPR